ncbi:MAG: NAD(P)/FAD-dependent oxidoreductase [Rhodobacterales bacterium]
MTQQIVIVGAGMAGLACARRLVAAGLSPVVLDKGRGIGGRMATRRVTLAGSEVRFDHGAQYLSVKTPDFAAALADVPEAVADWQIAPDMMRQVGLPGMSGLPRAWAEGLDIRQNAEVTAVKRADRGWRITTPEGEIDAAHLVLTIPAPQAAALLAGSGMDDAALANDLGAVQMEPCLTLMAAFPADLPRPFIISRSGTNALAWIAQDSAKPGRADHVTAWVAQASPDFSRQHLEADKGAIAALMLPLLCNALGCAPEAALYASAHRWRYARAAKPLGQPFLQRAKASLHIGGDWCLGTRVADAFASGDAIGRDIAQARHAE